jgi:hypothetical protein
MEFLCTIRTGDGRTGVYGTVYEVGPDLLVVIGGAGLHIGAATLAEPLTGETIGLQAIVGHTEVPGRTHKEGELTDRTARRLAEATGRRTLAISGIHLDRINRQEIEAIRSNVGELGRLLAERLRGGGPAGD